MADQSREIPGLVDSHAHLDMEEFDEDRDDVVRRAFGSGLDAILCPGDLTETRSLPTILRLIQDFPRILAAAGVHPHQANRFTEDQELQLRGLAAEGIIRAVGEIGLDFHYDFSPRDIQIEVLERQLACAGEIGLPVILHSRLSGQEVVSSVDRTGFNYGGILHCFTEDWPTARQMLDRGFHISFSGILTFPNARKIRDVAAKVPLDRLLVETDSPYLTPAPHRGRIKRNEPAFVVETARRLADLRGLSPEEFAEASGRNFFALFSSGV